MEYNTAMYSGGSEEKKFCNAVPPLQVAEVILNIQKCGNLI
jgi:hypothetical protein